MAITDTDRNHKSHNLSKKALVLLLVLGLSLLGCRIKSPSVAEQQALAERGAFPRGVPAWSSGAVAAAGAVGRQAPGIIPTQYERSSLPSSQDRPNINRAEVSRRAAMTNTSSPLTEADALETSDNRESQSELGRIEALCPGLESDVTSALTTVNIDDRIRQYRRLTSRCPESYDLWLWLAKDFYSAGRIAEAEKAANRVLSLDAGNSSASALITNIRRAK